MEPKASTTNHCNVHCRYQIRIDQILNIKCWGSTIQNSNISDMCKCFNNQDTSSSKGMKIYVCKKR